ncbi:UDP-N-acetylglucosamine 1-carboxyvinyltransferase [Tepidibacillus infernus]|uniref:UDP-N-acetylglucosamine 1-carboxyvinyltransferase n=1 Tax=Tepidibacillus decaturensis TaxID=1413211 RepID=A0A135L6I7_9BACI|nr:MULTISPECIES: UDP-N-acetylglucosamine 1-carboxyvinyltransferase [Tepidibacillus]KXG44634.1 UDP-N-acetylglucosamine 1-carboxyvinyltransferase [Tepidibacillus decaturensis]GBF11834.1 UDP-N-acetylglucosamine 1-carboxyvinyltransferase 1 [Tepidibacillus sp. HK-1]
MEKIIVRGGRQLSGSVKIHGAKNAVLPILAASILGEEGESIINDVPSLDDVYTIIDVLSFIGLDVHYKNEVVRINATKIVRTEAPYDLVRKMRASFLVMGPLLARKGHARIALPGGCAIGSRPVDQHLKGFEAMGAKISIGQGYIDASIDGKLTGARIYLDYASVGATENIMMAATLANGVTTIENAAQEPEIVDLANYLNGMGAKIRGAGTGTIRIEGVERLTATQHSVIPDRIEAGTFLVAAAITGGNVLIENAIIDHLKPVIAKLEEMGVQILEEEQGVRVKATHPLKAVDLKTLPHPGFPTDMQSQMMALLLIANGTSVITETVFENRFMHVEEFKRMNANIKIQGRTAVVEGNAKLIGTRVQATDLRAGAALVIAGLVATGETEVTELHHIDRGYVNFVGKLQALGADIERVADEVKSAQSLQPLWIS